MRNLDVRAGNLNWKPCDQGLILLGTSWYSFFGLINCEVCQIFRHIAMNNLNNPDKLPGLGLICIIYFTLSCIDKCIHI